MKLADVSIHSSEEAQAIVDEIETHLSFKEWKHCVVTLYDENREDRIADCTWGTDETMEVRLFLGGQDVGTLIHEIAHNSINCLHEIEKMFNFVYRSNEVDDVHTEHHVFMIRVVEDIYRAAF